MTGIMDVLNSEPIMPDVFQERSDPDRARAAAKFLSQTEFVEFPELSPLRNLEIANNHFVGAFGLPVILALGVLLRWGGNRTGEAVWMDLFLAGLALILMGLLYGNAKSNYLEGVRSTLISLREEADAQRSGVDQAEEIDVPTRQTPRGEIKRLRDEVIPNLSSDNSVERAKAINDFRSFVDDNLGFFGRSSDSLEIVLKGIDQCEELLERGRDRELYKILQVARKIVSETRDLQVYRRLEKRLTPILVEVIQSRNEGSIPAEAARDVASKLTDKRLIDAVVELVEQEEQPRHVAKRINLKEYLGRSILAHRNQEYLDKLLKERPVFSNNEDMSPLLEGIYGSLDSAEQWTEDWPKVFQD